jgi:hypothetical protein
MLALSDIAVVNVVILFLNNVSSMREGIWRSGELEEYGEYILNPDSVAFLLHLFSVTGDFLYTPGIKTSVAPRRLAGK